MIFQKICIPSISAFNWEGFQPTQIRDVQHEYCQQLYMYDIQYQQFRSNQSKDFILRLRDSEDAVIDTWTFNKREYSGVTKYSFVYDIYFTLEQDNGEYYLDIYNQTDDIICANTHPFYISDDVETWLPYEGYNEVDKDGWIFTEQVGQFVSTDDSVGKGVITINDSNIECEIELLGGSYAVVLDSDDNIVGSDTYTTTSISIAIPSDYTSTYYLAIYSSEDVLLSYSSPFKIEKRLGGYVLASQNRIRARFESNNRQDEQTEASTFNSFTDQDFDKRTTSSDENTIEVWTFGAKGVPNWVAMKINRFLGLTNIYRSGVQYSKVRDRKSVV